MIKFAPSILSADFSNLQDVTKQMEQAGADYVHIDVMDGNFVPNLTMGPCVIQSIRKHTQLVFDVHLMIQNPGQHIEAFANAGADIITIHAESTAHLAKDIAMIKQCGKKVGVALNPATPLEVLHWIRHDVEMVLLMTVNPGFGGQTFISGMIPKIQQLKKWRDEFGGTFDIEVDGGIHLENISEIKNAGANVIVAGSAFFQAPSMKDFVESIKAL